MTPGNNKLMPSNELLDQIAANIYNEAFRSGKLWREDTSWLQGTFAVDFKTTPAPTLVGLYKVSWPGRRELMSKSTQPIDVYSWWDGTRWGSDGSQQWAMAHKTWPPAYDRVYDQWELVPAANQQRLRPSLDVATLADQANRRMLREDNIGFDYQADLDNRRRDAEIERSRPRVKPSPFLVIAPYGRMDASLLRNPEIEP